MVSENCLCEILRMNERSNGLIFHLLNEKELDFVFVLISKHRNKLGFILLNNEMEN